MMTRLFYIVCFFACHLSCAQRAKWSEVIVDKNDGYEVPNEGKVLNTLFEVAETRDTIRSGMVVNNDPRFTILFTEAEIRGDTLRILIHQTDPAYHQEYIVLVFKGKYNVEYTLSAPIDPERSKMIATETKLKLNTLDFKKGTQIRGYTEYTGKCAKGCFEGNRPVKVKGNFVAIIK
jgi:hypothetical protein